MNTERRRHRSSNSFEAFHLFLASLADRSDADQLVVADEDGLVLDGIGDQAQLEVLAAYGPAAEAEGPVHSTLLPTAQGAFRLTSVGGRHPSSAETTAALARTVLAD